MTDVKGETPQSAHHFFKNDPRFRSEGAAPYTEDEMLHINTRINGIDVFEFAESFAASRGPNDATMFTRSTLSRIVEEMRERASEAAARGNDWAASALSREANRISKEFGLEGRPTQAAS